MIQVKFEEAESRTLSETGPMSCVVFVGKGRYSCPVTARLRVRELLCVVRETVICISNAGVCVVCTERIGKKS